MPYPIPNSLKTYALAGLAVLMTWLPLGYAKSAFAETRMHADIVMTIDESDDFGDEAEMFNNFLNAFAGAVIMTDGNLEVVVIDRNTICISTLSDSEGCSDQNLSRVTIRSDYD